MRFTLACECTSHEIVRTLVLRLRRLLGGKAKKVSSTRNELARGANGKRLNRFEHDERAGRSLPELTADLSQDNVTDGSFGWNTPWAY
jgi:DNA-binding SARP family transcriptional activator